MSEEILVLEVPAEEAGQRLDQYLAKKVADLSRTRIQSLIADQDVLVNDRAVKASYKTRPADKIEIEIPPPPVTELVPEPIPLDVVYEDEDIVVVSKPAGLVVHPGAGVTSGTLANALVSHFRQLSEAAGLIRPGIVHRLDKETSGLMVVAKNDVAHEKLAEQLRLRKVYKSYLALVMGRMDPMKRAGKIDAPIGRHPYHRTMMSVRPEGHGREAVTLYRVVETIGEFSLLEVEIKTGRTHQIRVHLADLGYPVVGDAVYGLGWRTKMKDQGVRSAVEKLGRHFLHAAKLRFEHPRTGQRMEFSSPLPKELDKLLTFLRARKRDA